MKADGGRIPALPVSLGDDFSCILGSQAFRLGQSNTSLSWVPSFQMADHSASQPL